MTHRSTLTYVRDILAQNRLTQYGEDLDAMLTCWGQIEGTLGMARDGQVQGLTSLDPEVLARVCDSLAGLLDGIEGQDLQDTVQTIDGDLRMKILAEAAS